MSKLVENRGLWSSLISQDDEAEVGVLGVPFDNAVSWRGGTRHAPQRIRSITPYLAFVTEEGTVLQVRVKDYGDMESDLNWERFFEATEARAAEIINSQHKLAFFLGGDHSVGIPLFKAFAKSFQGPVGYIQFDSHADLADFHEGHAWSHANTARRNLEQPNFSPFHLAFVGLRSFLTEELDFYAAHPEMGWHTARSVYRRGIEAVARDVIAQMKGVEAVYMSLDIDGIDPSCTPGTGTPEHGGPTTRECLEFLRLIFAELPIRAMDIVEVSPPLDISDVTSLAALKVMYEVFGFVQE
ncbi:MAG: agmatinase family protein [Anaerolineales bacterium]|nr:agmatinase family protein [Anaerolineales bacterium]